MCSDILQKSGLFISSSLVWQRFCNRKLGVAKNGVNDVPVDSHET